MGTARNAGQEWGLSAVINGKGPDALEDVMIFFRTCITWLSSFFGLAVPAFFGAAVGAYKDGHHERGMRKLVCSVLMSAACGCGLTPLFAYVFSLPDTVSSSLAFFLGVWGLEGIEAAQNMVRAKINAKRGYSSTYEGRAYQTPDEDPLSRGANRGYSSRAKDDE